MTLTEKFLIANKFCAKWEGTWDDDTDDPGGATKYGVCARLLSDQTDIFLKNILGFTHPITREKMRGLTKEQSQKVFFILFWQDLNLEPLPTRVAVVVHDYAVNCGGKTAIRKLQECHNSLYPNDRIAEDGIIGPKTIRAFTKMDNQHDLNAMLENRVQRYHRIVASKPALKKFLKGWLNRVNDLRDYLKDL